MSDPDELSRIFSYIPFPLSGAILYLLKKSGLPENVELSVEVKPAARKFVADSTFINRIVHNLVNNAVQAMPNGGKLIMDTYRDEKDIVMTVEDTGVGILNR